MGPTPDPSAGASPIRDQRATPRGVLPRQLQMWLMVGLPVLILGVILITGRTTPPPRPVSPSPAADPSALPPDRIHAYHPHPPQHQTHPRPPMTQTPTPSPHAPPPP